MSHEQLNELESIDLQDKILLELNVSHKKDQDRFKPLSKLSTGQQAILHLLLLDNKDPLIMDQPEDNLDNAFVAKGLYKNYDLQKQSDNFCLLHIMPIFLYSGMLNGLEFVQLLVRGQKCQFNNRVQLIYRSLEIR